MSDLGRLQSDFGRVLRGGDAALLRDRLAGDDGHLDRRLAIYRANVAANAVNALSIAYPVLKQVVGAEFFAGLARAYLRGHPSTHGDLGEFGDAFAAFVQDFEPAQALPYLPDLARLEWAVHLADRAADAPEWDPAALGDVPAERQAALRFAWSPGTALLHAGCPVVRIWTLHQPGQGGDFQVDWTVRECALVARDGYRVTVSAIDAAAAAFIAASLAGAPLGEAAQAGLDRDPAFDLGALLANLISRGLVRGHTLEGQLP